LEIQIKMMRPAGPEDAIAKGMTSAKGGSAGFIDLIAATADPRTDGYKYSPWLDAKPIAEAMNSPGDDFLRCSPSA
jgi:hypothetical protein